jgi:hypothetical protein
MRLKHSRLAPLATLALLTLLQGLGGAFAQPPALDDVIQGIRQYEGSLFEGESMMLRYARTRSEQVAAAKTGGLLPVEWTLARRGDRWFGERRFTQPGTTKKANIPAGPKTQVLSQRFFLDWDQEQREASLDIVDVDLAGNIYNTLAYLRNLSMNAAKYIAKSQGIDLASVRKRYQGEVDLPFLPDFLNENRDRYRVLPMPEEEGGASCWVVEWEGMDRFWVDPQRGFIIVRRIYNWGPGKPPRVEIRNNDYREAKARLWLPASQTELIYGSMLADIPALWGKEVCRCQYRLLEAQFDSVPESLFEIKLPAGTKVFDNYRKLQYTVSTGAGEPFGDAIAMAKPTRRWWQLSFWTWAAIGAVLLALIGFFVYRRRLALAR